MDQGRTSGGMLTRSLGMAVCVVLILSSPCKMYAAEEGPSFDCTKKLSPIEHLICRDQELSDLDRKLARVFLETRGTLDEGESQTLLSSQRSWLAQRSTECRSAERTADTPDAKASDENSCLKNMYIQRIEYIHSMRSRGNLVSETSYHPDYWGTDVVKKIADSNISDVPYSIRIKVVGVFEDYQGDILVRVAVGQRGSTQATPRYKNYEISLFEGRISPVADEQDSGTFSPPPDPEKWKIKESIIKTNHVIDDGHVVYMDNGWGGGCINPLSHYVNVFDKNNRKVHTFTIAQKISVAAGFSVGGDACEDNTPLHKLKTFAQDGIDLVQLRDGTFLAWPFTWASDLVRLDRKFHSEYRSAQVLVLDEKQLYSLPTDKGIDAVQRHVLSLFQSK